MNLIIESVGMLDVDQLQTAQRCNHRDNPLEGSLQLVGMLKGKISDSLRYPLQLSR